MSALAIIDFPVYLLGVMAVVLVPGPSILFVLATSTRYGVREGLRAVLGEAIADVLLVLLAVFGMAAVLKAYPQLYDGIKLTAAVFLAWLGFSMLRAARQLMRLADGAANSLQKPPGNTLLQAISIRLMNPKALFFFLFFFVQYVMPNAPNAALSYGLLALVHQLCNIAFLSALAFFGAQLASRYGRQRRWAAGGACAAGLLFFGFSLKLASLAL